MKNKFRLFILSAILSGALSNQAIAQDPTFDSLMSKFEQLGNYLLYRNHDSTYIQNFSNEFTLKLIAVNKFNYFRIRDKINNSTLRYRPDRRVNLGLGIAYKWFSLDIAFNVGIGENSNFKHNEFLDFQANIFSSRQYISASLQYYFGYRLTDYSGISAHPSSLPELRDDIRTIRLGLQYFYAFNYDKFSLKAPFILNEKQLKSAGSWLFGAGFNLFIMDGDSVVVPATALQDFQPELQMHDLNALSLLVSAGYMYTFIFAKDFFLTLGFIPGIGINMGDYQTQVREPFNLNASINFTTMNALGYNGRRVFGGIQFLGEVNTVKIDKKLKTDIGHGKAKVFVGYRFRNKKAESSCECMLTE